MGLLFPPFPFFHRSCSTWFPRPAMTWSSDKDQSQLIQSHTSECPSFTSLWAITIVPCPCWVLFLSHWSNSSFLSYVLHLLLTLLHHLPFHGIPPSVCKHLQVIYSIVKSTFLWPCCCLKLSSYVFAFHQTPWKGNLPLLPKHPFCVWPFEADFDPHLLYQWFWASAAHRNHLGPKMPLKGEGDNVVSLQLFKKIERKMDMFATPQNFETSR